MAQSIRGSWNVSKHFLAPGHCSHGGGTYPSGPHVRVPLSHEVKVAGRSRNPAAELREGDGCAGIADLRNRVQWHVDVGHCVFHADRDILVGDSANQSVSMVAYEFTPRCPKQLSSEGGCGLLYRHMLAELLGANTPGSPTVNECFNQGPLRCIVTHLLNFLMMFPGILDQTDLHAFLRFSLSSWSSSSSPGGPCTSSFSWGRPLLAEFWFSTMVASITSKVPMSTAGGGRIGITPLNSTTRLHQLP